MYEYEDVYHDDLYDEVDHEYENWCSEQDAQDWWDNMTVDEQTEVITSNAAYALSRTFGFILAPPEPF